MKNLKEYFEDVEMHAMGVQMENWGMDYKKATLFIRDNKRKIFQEWVALLENHNLTLKELWEDWHNSYDKRANFYEEFYEFLSELAQENMEKEE